MDNCTGLGGFMAVVAVSGSVALVALQIHKSLLSELMKKVESELGGGSGKCAAKKKVRFAKEVAEPSEKNKEYRKRRSSASVRRIAAIGSGAIGNGERFEEEFEEEEEEIPLNRLALYKGIADYRMLKRHSASHCL